MEEVIETVENECEEEPEAAKDFEAAIKECGFGLFNVFLLLATIPGLIASIFEGSTMSYVLPSAECDLQLTLMDKGALNAMTYAGAIVSAIPWGFIADSFGRKRILVWGLLLLGCVTLFSTFSQNANQLMLFKFFGGFLNSGPMAVILSYISEFHGKAHRIQILIALGMIKSVPAFLHPFLAYLILPADINISLWTFKFNSWKIFIAVTAIPAFLSGLLFMFFPESPKFLMAQGRNKEALEAFRTIYTYNKQLNRETYPITQLIDETHDRVFHATMSANLAKCRSCQKRAKMIIKFTDGLKQIRLLCSANYIVLVAIVYITYFSLIFSITPIRLWLPQYFATTKEMEFKGDNKSDTCHVLEYIIKKADHITEINENATIKENCEVHIEPDSFINNMFIAVAMFINFVLTTIAVRFIGNNFLLRVNMAVACYTLLSIYWSNSENITLTLASIFTATGLVSITLILNISISAFPTSMRTMALITLMSFGRFGGVLGNFCLSVFMNIDCVGMFAIYGAFLLFSMTISYFIPNTTKLDLK